MSMARRDQRSPNTKGMTRMNRIFLVNQTKNHQTNKQTNTAQFANE